MFTHTSTNNTDKNSVTNILANSWENRVAVKKEALDLSKYYDSNLPDYPLDLVPFRNDPRFIQLDEKTKQRILSGAWICYNEKTIAVENHIITPACSLLLRGKFDGLDNVETKRVVAQTLVDEEFHILMCLEACMISREMHDMESFISPKPVVVSLLEELLKNENNDEYKDIILFGFSTVAEITINAYLGLLSQNKTIQPINTETTYRHFMDEASHNKFFMDSSKIVYNNFDDNKKKQFIFALENGLKSFVQVDLSTWVEILKYVGFTSDESNSIVNDSKNTPLGTRLVRDYTSIKNLLNSLQINLNDFNFDFS